MKKNKEEADCESQIIVPSFGLRHARGAVHCPGSEKYTQHAQE